MSVVTEASQEEFAVIFFDGMAELYQEWVEQMRKRDPSFIRLPDWEDAMKRAKKEGILPLTQ